MIPTSFLLYVFLFCCSFELVYSTKTVNWIDLTDINAIYAEAGLANIEYSENVKQCIVRDDAFQVTCVSIRKCVILPLNVTFVGNSISADKLLERCGSESDTEVKLKVRRSTVTQLVFGGNKTKNVPGRFFCNVPNLASLDLSRNDLHDASNIGFESTCVVADSENCCGCNLKELILDKNEFQYLNNDIFCAFPALIVLRVSNCGLKEIELNAFRGLDKLKYVDLSKNDLTEISEGTFDSNTNLQIIFLSSNKLNESVLNVLQNLLHVRQLYLDSNQISSIDTRVFENFYELKVLKLQDNLITTLKSDLFFNLIRLRELDLSYNYLDQLNETTFAGLSDLMTLDLSNNQLMLIENGTFNDCGNLTNLKLSRNSLTNFPATVGSITNLKQLYMDRNNITSLRKNDFANLINLVQLDLSNNSIAFLEPGLFSSNINLITLKLTANRLINITNSFTEAKIINLFLDSNLLTSLSFSDFSANIPTLSITNNDITSVNWSDSYGNLQDLDLSCNLLTGLVNVKLPNSVINLRARKNKINFISYDSKFGKEVNDIKVKLETVELQFNDFEEICELTLKNVKHFFAGNPLQCSCENKWLKDVITSSTSETNIGDINSLRCIPTFNRFNSSTTYYLTSVNADNFLCESQPKTSPMCKCKSKSFCSVDCPDRCKCYFSYNFLSIYVDCGNLSLTSVPEAIDYGKISRSTVLFMDSNDLEYLNSSLANSFANLAALYLNDSRINSISDNVFRGLFSLSSLHLENNQLKTLPNGIFTDLKELRELYLQNNLLNTLANTIFNPLKSLMIMDLSHNKLTNFSVWDLRSLAKLKNLKVNANPWSCLCDFLNPFQSFIQNNTMKLTADDLYCTSPNGTLSDQTLIKYYYSKCVAVHSFLLTSTITYIWASLLAIFVFLTIIALLVFYYRHEMQVMIYSHYGVRVFSRNRSRTAEEDGKTYDAFIAYSSEDEEFIAYSLLPGLEQIARPYKLCLHQRDFAPGAFITDSILEAVEKSSRTIILLSESFVKSDWCKFEFKTAHVQMLHDRCTRVLMVVLGDIPSGVDPEMKLYLKTNTYLKWGEKLFWEKLYFALPERKDKPKSDSQLEMLSSQH